MEVDLKGSGVPLPDRFNDSDQEFEEHTDYWLGQFEGWAAQFACCRVLVVRNLFDPAFLDTVLSGVMDYLVGRWCR
jgi:hypothetical protein